LGQSTNAILAAMYRTGDIASAITLCSSNHDARTDDQPEIKPADTVNPFR
jgi:hypothetical protein